MCAEDKFKLCTCDSSSLKESEVGWVLKEEAGNSGKKGKPAKIEYQETLKETLDWITSQLNSGNEVFDFAIDSSKHYLLRIRLDHKAVDTFPHNKGDTWASFELQASDPRWKLLSGYEPGSRSIHYAWEVKAKGKVEPRKN
eukprot:TRINITY_DN2260_c1_g1_i3.p2 TRINITY_DN2260_c1_g1~~TRINITY_DN2260_c1_g1_i3.p2  ORF type:complete len:141 (+),score=29.22 TRINITY_DN2260_c1_g1_i3:872-1294(+)